MSRVSLSTLRHGMRRDVARQGVLRLLAKHLPFCREWTAGKTTTTTTTTTPTPTTTTTHSLFSFLNKSDRLFRHQPAVHRLPAEPPFQACNPALYRLVQPLPFVQHDFWEPPPSFLLLHQAKHLFFRKPLETLLCPFRILLLPVIPARFFHWSFRGDIADLRRRSRDYRAICLVEVLPF